jgi:small subunit ribosomal protein S14
MAKASTINRNEKRKILVKKYKSVRDELRKKMSDLTLTPEARFQAALEMQKLPRDSSAVRLRNRCMHKRKKKTCGRPRANIRLTGLCRIHTRTVSLEGLIPGVHKASW